MSESKCALVQKKKIDKKPLFKTLFQNGIGMVSTCDGVVDNGRNMYHECFSCPYLNPEECMSKEYKEFHYDANKWMRFIREPYSTVKENIGHTLSWLNWIDDEIYDSKESMATKYRNMKRTTGYKRESESIVYDDPDNFWSAAKLTKDGCVYVYLQGEAPEEQVDEMITFLKSLKERIKKEWDIEGED